MATKQPRLCASVLQSFMCLLWEVVDIDIAVLCDALVTVLCVLKRFHQSFNSGYADECGVFALYVGFCYRIHVATICVVIPGVPPK